jgi:hypothetical protein
MLEDFGYCEAGSCGVDFDHTFITLYQDSVVQKNETPSSDPDLAPSTRC